MGRFAVHEVFHDNVMCRRRSQDSTEGRFRSVRHIRNTHEETGGMFLVMREIGFKEVVCEELVLEAAGEGFYEEFGVGGLEEG